MRPLILLAAMCATEINAQEIFSCEALPVAVEFTNLEAKTYDKIYPSIIINEDAKSVSFIYLKHDQQWKKDYSIEVQIEDKLIGVHTFNEDTISIFHFDKANKTFNVFFSGGDYFFGNTLTSGVCFD